MGENGDDNRRKELRFLVNATVVITGKESGDVVYGVCSDVSDSGIRVKTNNPLPADEVLELEINDQKTIVTAEAEKAFYEEKDGTYITGLKAKFDPDNKLEDIILNRK